jgi:hypothetical protein
LEYARAPLPGEWWDSFVGKVEASGFWSLPYDDGKRLDGSGLWDLEGYKDGRYHTVVQRHKSEVAKLCVLLRSAVAP